MTGMLMEIRGNERESQRALKLDKGFSDALRDYCKHRWPVGTAKLAAREWDLTQDEGRGIVAGTASKTTIEKVFKRGGPLVALPIMEEVMGVSIARFFRDLRGVHNDHAQRIGALVGDLIAVPAPYTSDPADDHSSLDDGARARDRRVG